MKKKPKEGSAVVPDLAKNSEPEMDPMVIAAEEIMEAIKSGNAYQLAEALKSAVLMAEYEEED